MRAGAGAVQPVIAGVVASLVGFASTFALVLAGLRAVGASEAEAASGLATLCFGGRGRGLARPPLPPAARDRLVHARRRPARRGRRGPRRLPGRARRLRRHRRADRRRRPVAHARALGRGHPGRAGQRDAGGRPPPGLPGTGRGRGRPSGPGAAGDRHLGGADAGGPPLAVPGALAVAAIAIAVDPREATAPVGCCPPSCSRRPRSTPARCSASPSRCSWSRWPRRTSRASPCSQSFGYRPPITPALVSTGAATVVGAPFGAHAINLAAITAALAAGPDAHPDPARRWIASVAGGVAYLVLGLTAGLAAALVAVAPPLLIEAVAGLALFGALAGALAAAMADAARRDAAIVTFVVSASGSPSPASARRSGGWSPGWSTRPCSARGWIAPPSRVASPHDRRDGRPRAGARPGARPRGRRHRADPRRDAARVFSRLGAAAEPARRTHDAIAGAAYAAVAGSAVLAGRAAGAALPPRELSTTRRGAMALAVLGGLHGDRLEAEGSPLHEPMALRVDGRVARVPEDFAGATGRLVVLVHGLFETEHAWTLASDGYGARLARDLGATPLYVATAPAATSPATAATSRRCSTPRWRRGRCRSSIAPSGTRWAGSSRAAPATTAAPSPPTSGTSSHSARPTRARPSPRGSTTPPTRSTRSRRRGPWPGSCGAGARASATCAPRRSSTRTGRVATPMRCAPRPARRCRCSGRDPCFVTATVTRDPRHPVGRLVGDWLVLEPSASGRGRVAFDATNGLTSAGHTTWRCSTTPRSTRSCATGCAGGTAGRGDAHVDAHVGAVDPHDGLLGPRRVDVGDHARAPVGQLQLRPDRIRHDHLAEDLHDRGVERGPGTAADDAHADVRRLGRREGRWLVTASKTSAIAATRGSSPIRSEISPRG